MFDPAFFYLAYLSLFLFDNFLFLSISNVDKSCSTQINYSLLLGNVHTVLKISHLSLIFPWLPISIPFFAFPKIGFPLFSWFLIPIYPSWFSSFPYCWFPGSLLSVPFFLVKTFRHILHFFCSRSVPYSQFTIPPPPPVPYFPVSYLQFYVTS